MRWSEWNSLHEIGAKEFVCGFCANKVAPHKGYFGNEASTARTVNIYICPNCAKPTYFDLSKTQIPGPMLGRDVASLPDDVKNIYNQIRSSIKNNLYTGALLLGRKLIMHLAVDVAGAKEGDTFAGYIDHLETSGYLPKNGEKLLKYVKDLGNEKNHELKEGTQDEATKILIFIEAILIFMYEFPAQFEDKVDERALVSK